MHNYVVMNIIYMKIPYAFSSELPYSFKLIKFFVRISFVILLQKNLVKTSFELSCDYVYRKDFF